MRAKVPPDVQLILDAVGVALGKAMRTMRDEAAEKREAAMIPLRQENARLLIRIAALEAKVEGRPSEGTVLDMTKALTGRRRAA